MTKDEKIALTRRMYELRNESVATRVKMHEAHEQGNELRYGILRRIWINRQRREGIIRKRAQTEKKFAAHPEKLEKYRKQGERMEYVAQHEILRLQKQLGDIDQEEFEEKKQLIREQAKERKSRRVADLTARATPAATPGRHKANGSGKSVRVTPKVLSPPKFMALVKHVAKFAKRLAKMSGGVGGEVKQKVFNYKSGASKFTIHAIESAAGIVSISASLVTPRGKKSFSGKRSAL